MEQMQLNGFDLWSQRCMIEYGKFVQYVAVLDDSRWLKRALVWNAGGGRLGQVAEHWSVGSCSGQNSLFTPWALNGLPHHGIQEQSQKIVCVKGTNIKKQKIKVIES